MKNVSAKATFSDKAKSLFSAKETSREIANRVLESRGAHESAASGQFVVGGHSMRTDRPLATKAASVLIKKTK